MLSVASEASLREAPKNLSIWCERAWLGGDSLADGVLLTVFDGVFASVTAGVAPPPGAERVRGLVLPGIANAHSHAFHRALRGRTHAGAGSFWTWRDQMYALATRLDPDSYCALATAVFAEMVLAGYTSVGEFHYLHHGRGGVPYADPNAMSVALIDGAQAAGIRLTLLDTCYLDGGFGTPLNDVQQRFSDGSVDVWAERNDRMDSFSSSTLRMGAAIHSVRALSFGQMTSVASWAAGRACPLHAHVSEQPAENEACLAHTGRTPTGLLADAGAVMSSFTAVHATHLTDADVAIYGAAKATACLCPTTERDLADGIGPSAGLVLAGACLCIGSDSHAVIDPFEELRAIEAHQRLRTHMRGVHRPSDLLHSGAADGYRSIGWNGGALAAGAVADLVVVDPSSVRLAGCDVSSVSSVVFAASAADVRDVMVDGRWVVREGCHGSVDAPFALMASIESLWSGS